MNKIFFIGLIISSIGYSQGKPNIEESVKKDSLVYMYKRNDSLLKVLEKEYIPFRNLSFNKSIITPKSNIKDLIKIFKIKPKKCKDVDEDGAFEYICYFIGNRGTEIGYTATNVKHIADNSIYFDYYPELRIGKPLNVLKLYFPSRYKNLVSEHKNWIENKKIEKRNQFYIIPCEVYENAYPDHMNFLSLSIEFDLITMEITGFTFYEGYE